MSAEEHRAATVQLAGLVAPAGSPMSSIASQIEVAAVAGNLNAGRLLIAVDGIVRPPMPTPAKPRPVKSPTCVTPVDGVLLSSLIAVAPTALARFPLVSLNSQACVG